MRRMNIHKLTGTDGQIIANYIVDELRDRNNVVLSFHGTEFLNDLRRGKCCGRDLTPNQTQYLKQLFHNVFSYDMECSDWVQRYLEDPCRHPAPCCNRFGSHYCVLPEGHCGPHWDGVGRRVGDSAGYADPKPRVFKRETHREFPVQSGDDVLETIADLNERLLVLEGIQTEEAPPEGYLPPGRYTVQIDYAEVERNVLRMVMKVVD